MKRIIAVTAALLIALAFSFSSLAREGAEIPSTIAGKAPRPLTSIGAAKQLLTLAERMQGQGMIVEAEAVMSIIPTVLTGTPAKNIKPASALCGTDTECAELDKRRAK